MSAYEENDRIIKLPNRYNEDVYLELMNDSRYTLHTEMDYMRVIYDQDKTSIFGVDPSGGPFITQGYEVCGGEMVVSDIEQDESNNIVITLKKNEQ